MHSRRSLHAMAARHPPAPDPRPACVATLPLCADQGHGFMPSYVYRQLSEWYLLRACALPLCAIQPVVPVPCGQCFVM